MLWRYSSAWVRPVARADTIDDFVLTGNQQVISFSLPAVLTTYNSPSVASVSASTVGTVNGIGGASIYATFFAPGFFLASGLQLSVNGNAVGTSLNGLLSGPDVVVFLINPPPIYNGLVPLQFVPGTYTESSAPNPFFPNYQPFTLAITQEASPVPEPDSLLLLGTGCVCLLGGIAGRASRFSGLREMSVDYARSAGGLVRAWYD